MRYFVTLDPAPGAPLHAVDLTESPTGELLATVDGKPVEVDVAAVGATLSVRVDGRMIDLTTEGELPELGAIANGHRSYVRVESERYRAAAAAKNVSGGAGDRFVKSPMPGRVVRLLVKAKDQVTQGQTLCVIEAMKMENEVKAKADCTIAEVHVREGSTVEGSGKLFTLA